MIVFQLYLPGIFKLCVSSVNRRGYDRAVIGFGINAPFAPALGTVYVAVHDREIRVIVVARLKYVN